MLIASNFWQISQLLLSHQVQALHGDPLEITLVSSVLQFPQWVSCGPSCGQRHWFLSWCLFPLSPLQGCKYVHIHSTTGVKVVPPSPATQQGGHVNFPRFNECLPGTRHSLLHFSLNEARWYTLGATWDRPEVLNFRAMCSNRRRLTNDSQQSQPYQGRQRQPKIAVKRWLSCWNSENQARLWASLIFPCEGKKNVAGNSPDLWGHKCHGLPYLFHQSFLSTPQIQTS